MFLCVSQSLIGPRHFQIASWAFGVQVDRLQGISKGQQAEPQIASKQNAQAFAPSELPSGNHSRPAIHDHRRERNVLRLVLCKNNLLKRHPRNYWTRWL